MSFGFGIGDFVAVIGLANKIRKDFSTAPEQYQGLAADVKSLSIILQDVDTFVAGNELSEPQETNICEIGDQCKKILEDVNKALDKYSNLSMDLVTPNDRRPRDRSFKKRAMRAWQQVKLEPAEFRDYRDAINSSVSMLGIFMDSITRDGMVKLIETQKYQENQVILEWLSTADYQSQQANNIHQRLENTGQWLLESPEYKRWRSSKELLFLHGIAGAGKTILSSIIIKDLQKTCCEDLWKSSLLYFYCDYRQQEAQQIDQIMLTWLRQLAENFNQLPQQIKELYERCRQGKGRPKLEEIRTTMRSIATGRLTRLYVVVDALDECQTINGYQRQLMDEILYLNKNAGASVIATSRPLPHIQATFDGSISMEIRALSDDIRTYINHHIAELPSFVINSLELQEQTRTDIIDSADSLFLLAKLNIEALKGITTKKKFRKALSSLTQHKCDYAAAYEKTMALINSQRQDEKDLALRVLAWVVLARQPLTVFEVSQALAIEPGESILDEDNIPELPSIISVCYGLVSMVAETGMLQLIHYTAQEFFKGAGLRWVQPFEIEVANTCLSYLSLREFDNGPCTSEEQLSPRFKKFVFYKYASCYWGLHVKSGASPTMVRGFLSQGKRVAASSQALLSQNKRSYDLDSWTPLHSVAYFGLYDWVDYVLELCKTEFPDHRQYTALVEACRQGHVDIVHTLIEKGAHVDVTDSSGCAAIIQASWEGHEAVVDFLLERGAQVDITWVYDWTALIQASRRGHEGIVRILMEYGAQVNFADIDGYTALIHASLYGDQAVVRLLLENGAQVNVAATSDGRTALVEASRRGHKDVVSLLLEKGAELNIASNAGQTALMNASLNGHETVIRLLLDRGAQLDATDKDGWTALMWASHEGHTAVVCLLLNRGAQLDIADKKGRTALIWASQYGHRAVVCLLLDRGAQVGLTDKTGWTALRHARYFDYDAIVHLLKEKSARSSSSNAVTERAFLLPPT